MHDFDSLDSELVAKIIAERAEKALAVDSDLEWWAILLESFYGSGPIQPEPRPHPAFRSYF